MNDVSCESNVAPGTCPPPRPLELDWELEIATLLGGLSQAQDELLSLLSEKRQFLVNSNLVGLAGVQAREAELLARLEGCLDHRARLLAWASQDGLPSQSIQALSLTLSPRVREELSPQLAQASARSRLLGHHSLSNWVVAQRTLLYLSHLLEIIATGGRMQPTYEKDASAAGSGSLVDQAA